MDDFSGPSNFMDLNEAELFGGGDGTEFDFNPEDLGHQLSTFSPSELQQPPTFNRDRLRSNHYNPSRTSSDLPRAVNPLNRGAGSRPAASIASGAPGLSNLQHNLLQRVRPVNEKIDSK